LLSKREKKKKKKTKKRVKMCGCGPQQGSYPSRSDLEVSVSVMKKTNGLKGL